LLLGKLLSRDASSFVAIRTTASKYRAHRAPVVRPVCTNRRTVLLGIAVAFEARSTPAILIASRTSRRCSESSV
jgi:hypothetical protein